MNREEEAYSGDRSAKREIPNAEFQHPGIESEIHSFSDRTVNIPAPKGSGNRTFNRESTIQYVGCNQPAQQSFAGGDFAVELDRGHGAFGEVQRHPRVADQTGG